MVLLALIAATVVSGVGAHAQDVSSTGSREASVMLEVGAALAPSLSLRLSAETLVFDVTRLGATGTVMRCAIGVRRNALAMRFTDGEAQVAQDDGRPAGGWPDFQLVGGRPLVAYPPGVADGEGSVVCHQAFVIDLHANTDDWVLVAGREDRPGGRMPGVFAAATCIDDAGADLHELAQGRFTTLMSGRPAGTCAAMLVVVALDLDGAPAGTAITDLQYTLMTVDADFSRR